LTFSRPVTYGDFWLKSIFTIGGSLDSSGFTGDLSLLLNPLFEFIFLCFFGEADFNLLTGVTVTSGMGVKVAADYYIKFTLDSN